MRRSAFVVTLVLTMLAVVVVPAGAVQYGTQDGNGHPYVGLVVFYADAGATQPLWRCTGALISPTVLLTAGHCTGIDPDLNVSPARAQVWFDAGPIIPAPGGYPLAGGYLGTPHPHPAWNGFLTIPNTNDVGVVVLDAPLTTQGYARVAPLGYLDSLATRRGQQNVDFTIVGYGLQSVKPVLSGLRERWVGTVQLVNLRSALTDGYNLHYSNDPGVAHMGGTCFGDSGGPVFSTDAHGDTWIVAVNSFVLNLNCKGAGFGYRVDIQNAQDFLGGF